MRRIASITAMLVALGILGSVVKQATPPSFAQESPEPQPKPRPEKPEGE
jgi:hypothetical protein